MTQLIKTALASAITPSRIRFSLVIQRLQTGLIFQKNVLPSLLNWQSECGKSLYGFGNRSWGYLPPGQGE
ncbi:hypothetical protein OKW09_005327 [Pseudomonas rhodesiae]|nr:hypothetical protein [Pseudomonas rhodesiae]MDF9772959.1 hypothetical protein [Pseudomonas rhodesiae]